MPVAQALPSFAAKAGSLAAREDDDATQTIAKGVQGGPPGLAGPPGALPCCLLHLGSRELSGSRQVGCPCRGGDPDHLLPATPSLARFRGEAALTVCPGAVLLLVAHCACVILSREAKGLKEESGCLCCGREAASCPLTSSACLSSEAALCSGLTGRSLFLWNNFSDRDAFPFMPNGARALQGERPLEKGHLWIPSLPANKVLRRKGEAAAAAEASREGVLRADPQAPAGREITACVAAAGLDGEKDVLGTRAPSGWPFAKLLTGGGASCSWRAAEKGRRL